MSAGYRANDAMCPVCGGELLPRETSVGSIIDVCADCEGIWVDWFDGDLALVASGEDAEKKPASPPGSARSPASNRAPGCPRCKRPLAPERYVGYGPPIFRCGECAGAFVPRSSAAELSGFERIEGETEQRNAAEEGFLRALLERVRAALGMGG